jgi:hypothetical protein
MDTVKIHNPVQSEFAMVPNSLWSMPVSCTAKAIFAYLLSFRDQSTVRVALIEQALKLGRDKRQNAMRELEEHGLICRQIERVNGRIVTRSLLVTTEPLLRRLVAKLDAEKVLSDLPPENPAVGSQSDLPPEKQAVGKSGPLGPEKPQNSTLKSGPLYNTKIKKGPKAPNLSSLGNYQRSCLFAGNPVLIGGVVYKPSAPEFAAMLELLRKEGACNERSE